MTADLTLYDLAPSPNNIKIRVALGYKKIPYKRVLVPFDDRSEVLRVSGQPLCPVITHGDGVLYDSGAILRYIDANFQDSPRLFASTREEMNDIEQWEMFGRAEIISPLGMLFRSLVRGEGEIGPVGQEASGLMNKLTERVEKHLESNQWLCGDSLTAADITVGCPIYYGMLKPDHISLSPFLEAFSEHLKLGEGREKTREWVERVVGFDRP